MDDEDEGERVSFSGPEIPEQLPWSRRAQAIAAVLWPSFLAAAFATMLFFAFVDPEALRETMRIAGTGAHERLRPRFLFFLADHPGVQRDFRVFLLRTARRNGQSDDKDS